MTARSLDDLREILLEVRRAIDEGLELLDLQPDREDHDGG